MLVHLFVAISFASLLTAMLAFRFELWRRPWILTAYLAFFTALELALETFVLPPDAFGPEVGVVCLVITALFVGVSFGVRRLLRSEG